MADTKNGGQKRNGLINKIVGGAVVLVVILLIVFIKKDKTVEEPADANAEEVLIENDALSVAQPVASGDYEYTFSGIKWIFDTESPEVAGTNQTWVKLEFADFTRNGNAIAFTRPYKLGVHKGTCNEVNFIDSSAETGIPIAYARCEGEGVVHEFVVLQELENVVVKMKETESPSNTSGQIADAIWKEWYKINVTEIVK